MSHHLRYLANCSTLFAELPLLERAAAARTAGFGAVEFWWPFADAVPAAADVDAFVASVESASVQLVGLNFAAGDMPGGDRGLVSWAGREAEFRGSVDIAVGIAARLGVSVFNALYGNRIAGLDPASQDEVARSNLVYAVQAANTAGATVLIEPVSGAQRYPLLVATDALAVIADVRAASGLHKIALLADLYHLAVNGDDVDVVVSAHADGIGHVQIADAPGRHEPGTGTLPIERYLDALWDGGYRGYVGLEYIPATTTIEGLDWLALARRAVRPATLAAGQETA